MTTHLPLCGVLSHVLPFQVFFFKDYHVTKMHLTNYTEDYVLQLGTFIQHSDYDHI